MFLIFLQIKQDLYNFLKNNVESSACELEAAVGDLGWPRAINCSRFEGLDGLPLLVAAEPDVPPLDELPRAGVQGSGRRARAPFFWKVTVPVL
jgi:hypothetical protein